MHNWSVFITDQCSFDEGLFFLSFSSFMIKADDKLCVTGASFTMSWKRSSTFLRVARIKCRRFLGLFVCSIPNETSLRHSKWFKQTIDFDNDLKKHICIYVWVYTGQSYVNSAMICSRLAAHIHSNWGLPMKISFSSLVLTIGSLHDMKHEVEEIGEIKCAFYTRA